MPFDLFNFHQMIKENKIILSFEGTFSQGILRNMVETLQEKLEAEIITIENDGRQQIAQRVYSVFIEMSQNIQYYSSEKISFEEKDVGTGIIVIHEDDEHFSLHSGNLVGIAAVDAIRKHLDMINRLDLNELKKLYKATLKQPRQDDKKGAGVGLIKIARTSENKIDYNFKPIDQNQLFFSLVVTINKN